MKAGDKVVCRRPRGFGFTEDKEYTLQSYEPEYTEPGNGFTWPAYAILFDDRDKLVCCHADRFEVVA